MLAIIIQKGKVMEADNERYLQQIKGMSAQMVSYKQQMTTQLII